MSELSFKNYLVLSASLLLYIFIGFFVERHETAPLLLTYSFLFIIYIYILKQKQSENISFWIFAAIVFRVALSFCTPSLSDDFYRFIWDGRLLAAGLHPFAEVPSHYIDNKIIVAGLDEALYEKLNSKHYFTVYPPVCQFIFWVSAKTGASSIYGSMLVMKLFILASEIGTLLLIPKILNQFGLNKENALIYAINPLIIIELTGNIHLEALMIFFMLLSIYYLKQQRNALSAIAFGIAVCVKFLPLLFLPFLIARLGLKKGLTFCAITGVTCIILFIPLADFEIITGLSQSLGYYFNKFEFNASLYYLIRTIGYWTFGFNIIQAAGWILAFIAMILILYISFDQDWNEKQKVDRSIFVKALWCLSVFLLFTTTLHPWYITLLLVLSVFTPYRFVVVWTGVIFLTYAGYSANAYFENLWLVSLEYLVVWGYLIYELQWKKIQTTY